MKRKVLLICGLVIVLLIIVIVALPFVVDVNHFRPQIEAQMQQALGRPVQIGEMHLSILAGGASASNISIGEDPAFGQQPFLQAKSLDVGVQLWPLLMSHTLHVTGLTLREPQVRLVRGSGGRWNFSSLGAGAAANASNAPAPRTARRGKAQRAPQSAAPQTNAAASGAENFSIDSLKIADGRVIVASTANPRAHTYDSVNLKAEDISYTSQIPFTVDTKTPGGGSIHVEGKAGPINRENAAQTPLNAKISVKHLDLAATGFVDPASGLAGIVDYDGTLQSDGHNAGTKGKVTANQLKLVRSGAPARQPVAFDYATQYNLQDETGSVTRGQITTGHTAATLSGTYQSRADGTVLHMRLAGNNMPVGDIEGLLPALGVVLPPGSSLQGGTASANLAIEGPLDHLVITGPVNVSNTQLAGYNIASKMKFISALAGISGGNSTTIQTLSSNLRIAPEGIQAQNLNLIVPTLGSLTGAGTIGANNALNFRMLAKLVNGGGLLGGISQITSLGQAKGQIPFSIQGTTSHPMFMPDVGKAIGNTVTAPAQGVGSVLNGLFGHHR